jgi:hypothetical protein
MPVRQRSPTNNSFHATTLPEDPMAFQTIRGRNPDGSTTVYRVHESVIHGGAGGNGGMYFGDCSSNTTNSMMYGAQPSAYGAPPPYAGHMIGSQHHHQPYQQQVHPPQPYNIVYAQRSNNMDTDYESSDDEQEGDTRAIATIGRPLSTPSHRQRGFMRRCNRTSIPCVLLGILMAISFIVGYVFMLEAIVNRSRPSHGNVDSQQQQQQQQDMSIERTAGTASNSKGNGGNQQPLMEVAQLLNLEPQYFVVNKVLQPVKNVAEVMVEPPPSQSSGVALVGQPRSMSSAATTTPISTTTADGSDNASVVEQQQQLRGSAVRTSNSIEITNNIGAEGDTEEHQFEQTNKKVPSEIRAGRSRMSRDNNIVPSSASLILSSSALPGIIMSSDPSTVDEHSEYPIRRDGPVRKN